MTLDDAIRILNPDHKLEPNEGIEQVEEACRIAVQAMKEVKEKHEMSVS